MDFAGLGAVRPYRCDETLSPIVRRAMQAIELHLGELDLTASRVAKRAGISLRYLQTLFAAAGETPTRFIRRRRLQHCCRDLGDPALAGETIADISLRWGFSDPAYFSRVFKQDYGVAPSQYRRHSCFADRADAASAED